MRKQSTILTLGLLIVVAITGCQKDADPIAAAAKIADALTSMAPPIERNTVLAKYVTVLTAISQKRPETAEFVQKYLASLQANDGNTYLLKDEFQSLFYSEPQVVKLEIENHTVTDLNTAQYYHAYARLLFGEEPISTTFRNNWSALASTKFAHHRLPSAQLRQKYADNYPKTAPFLPEIEVELLKDPSYRQAGARFYNAYAAEIQRKVALQRHAQEYLAYYQGKTGSSYPADDSILGQAWRQAQALDTTLSDCQARRMQAGQEMLEHFEAFLATHPNHPAVKALLVLVK